MTATKSSAAAQPAARILELDGLRGVAILTVVSLHYLWARIPLPSSGLWRYVVRVGLTGWAGVDLFFVLSGFLIGGIVLNARQSGRYYSTFYARRICRIFPLYFAVLAITAIAALAGPDWMRPLAGRTSVPWLA